MYICDGVHVETVISKSDEHRVITTIDDHKTFTTWRKRVVYA